MKRVKMFEFRGRLQRSPVFVMSNTSHMHKAPIINFYTTSYMLYYLCMK